MIWQTSALHAYSTIRSTRATPVLSTLIGKSSPVPQDTQYIMHICICKYIFSEIDNQFYGEVTTSGIRINDAAAIRSHTNDESIELESFRIALKV